MRIKNLNNAAFTLMEVLLSAVIFVVTVGGLFVTLNAVRAPVATKSGSLTAALFGKQVLEALRGQVNAGAQYYACTGNANPCPDFSLSLGTHQVPVANLPAGITWPATLSGLNLVDGVPTLIYTVSCADSSAAPCTNTQVAHQVTLKICTDAAC